MPRKKKKKNSRLGHESGRRHERVKAQLWAMAAALKPGTALPTQPNLVRQLGVARVTLSRAIQALVGEGRLEVRPRDGVYSTARAGLRTVAYALYYDPYGLGRFDQALISALGRYAPDYGLFIECVLLGLYENQDPERVAAFHRAVQARRYAGLLSITRGLGSAQRADLERLGLPLVFNPVAIDYSALERLGVQMLQGCGAKKIAFFFWKGPSPSGDEDFRTALARHGLKFHPEWYVPVAFEHPLELSGYRTFVAHWKKWSNKPDALLSNNDQVTRGIIDAAVDLGIQIPGELRIATHANRGLSEFRVPEVVRMDVDIEQMARRMLEATRAKIDGHTITENVPLELVPVG